MRAGVSRLLGILVQCPRFFRASVRYRTYRRSGGIWCALAYSAQTRMERAEPGFVRQRTDLAAADAQTKGMGMIDRNVAVAPKSTDHTKETHHDH